MKIENIHMINPTDKIVETVLEESTYGKGTRKVRKLFTWILRIICLGIVAISIYWIFATDRYVSEATVIIQNTQSSIASSISLGSMLGFGTANTNPDQLLLLEHLLSIDMLKRLDAELDLRAHYTSEDIDFISRLRANEPIEKFYAYFQKRIEVKFDDFSGVLRIRVIAFTPTMAQKIAEMIMQSGETYMNALTHKLALGQVSFLEKQVDQAYEDVIRSSEALVTYQNKEGLASPEATAESMIGIVAGLEGRRTEIETQLASLPRNLAHNHPTKIMLNQSLEAVQKQIAEERGKLASVMGRSLNTLIAEHQRLQMELEFKTEVYKTALVALEAGRMEASRTIKQVSVLQNPLLPEYPLEPRRLYNIVTTLLVGLLLLGMLKLLESIILDHVD